MLRRIGLTFGRFVGLAVTLYGLWLLGVTVFHLLTGPADYESSLIVVLILGSGALSAAGGIIYLLSFDGSPAWRSRRIRAWAVASMIVGTLLPNSLSFFLFPMTLLVTATVVFDRSLMGTDQAA
ncbi:MAG: hypothetical protein ACE5F5_00235 [Acidimicrobiia bacterium]